MADVPSGLSLTPTPRNFKKLHIFYRRIKLKHTNHSRVFALLFA
jgi:hypothetical protein